MCTIVRLLICGNTITVFRFKCLPGHDTDLIESCVFKSKGQITALGHLLSHLPVDITIGKMMLMASLFHTVDAVLNVAAGLSTLSVFTHKSFRSSDAKGIHFTLCSFPFMANQLGSQFILH